MISYVIIIKLSHMKVTIDCIATCCQIIIGIARVVVCNSAKAKFPYIYRTQCKPTFLNLAYSRYTLTDIIMHMITI